MTTLEWLYLALAVFTVVVGGLLAAVLWQVSVLVATLRASVLPQLQVLLAETQKSLVHAGSITRDVEHKLSKLEETVDDINVTTHSVATTARFFSEGVARPLMLNLAAAISGAAAAYQKYRELRREREQRRLGESASGPAEARRGEREEARAR